MDVYLVEELGFDHSSECEFCIEDPSVYSKNLAVFLTEREAFEFCQKYAEAVKIVINDSDKIPFIIGVRKMVAGKPTSGQWLAECFINYDSGVTWAFANGIEIPDYLGPVVLDNTAKTEDFN